MPSRPPRTTRRPARLATTASAALLALALAPASPALAATASTATTAATTDVSSAVTRTTLGLPGAKVPFVSQQAESARTNGTLLGPDWAYGTAAAEASGRRAVRLDRPGQYVEFTLTRPANAVNLRYSIPDSPDGAGLDATLSVSAGGRAQSPLALTSRYSWYYGIYPWTNTPADGGPRQRFDDARMRFDRTLPAGTKVRFAVGADDHAPSYTLDVADFEQVAAPIPAPAGAIDVVADHGADPTGATDSSAAIQAALDQGAATGRAVYLPAGTFTVTRHLVVDHVTLVGAGTWYSVLHGLGVGVYGRDAPAGSTGVHLAHFAILGETTERVDSDQVNAIGGAMNHSTVDDVWMQHTKVGAWMDGPMTDLHLTRLRILDTNADGVNFHRGVTDSSVSQSFVRNTGDDGLAMWSDTDPDQRNSFDHDTVSNPTLANTIAVYGGSDNRVELNRVADTLTEGGGVQVANRFGSVPLAGTTSVRGNLLERTGSLGLFSHIGWGALWFWAGDAAMTGTVDARANVIANSAYEAVQVYGDHPVSNVALRDSVIYRTGTFAVQQNTSGSGSAQRVVATGIGAPAARYDCSSGFAVSATASFGLDTSTCGYPAPGPLRLDAGDLTFTGTPVGEVSDAQTITVTNPTDQPRHVESVTTTGSYRLESTCPTTLAPHASCTVAVRFAPTPTGDRGGAVTISDGTSAGRYQVYLTGAVSAPTVGNLAAGAPVSTTSAVPGFPGTSTTDSKTDTYWESAANAFPQSATVELGEPRQISTVALKLPQGWGPRTQTLSVEGSTDGTTWTTLVPSGDQVFAPSSDNTVSLAFDPVTVSRVRVSVTANTGWPAAQLSEIELYR